LSATFNPPYSLFRTSAITGEDRFKFIEGHKWMLDADFYTPLVGKLILHAKANMGFLGKYSADADYSPFGHFILGGAGLGLQGVYNVGAEIIGLRGYNEGVLLEPTLKDAYRLATNQVQINRLGGVAYSKYALELRYLVSPSPQATIFVMAFAEAGNSWGSFDNFNPFKLRRTVGIGARIFMPAFGQLGIDYGKGFDPIPGLPDQGLKSFTFSIGQQIR
jgi:outer membrane protein insertion porin family